MAVSVPLPTDDRLQAALTAAVELILPRVMGQLACFAAWEYRVVSVTPGSAATPTIVAGVPVDVTRCPFGPLTVPMWPGNAWGYSLPITGSIVVVRFNDGNPGKPRIDGLDPSTPPTSVLLGSPLATPATLAGPLATLITAACAAAATAAVPGDGGKTAFTTFSGAMSSGAAGYAAKIVKAT